MTALQWVGLVWGSLTALGIRPALQSRERLIGRDPARMCRVCRTLRREHWHREREWRYEWGNAAGPPLMVLASATVRWTAPLLPALRRLARLPALPQCAGPACAAHRRYRPIAP